MAATCQATSPRTAAGAVLRAEAALRLRGGTPSPLERNAQAARTSPAD